MADPAVERVLDRSPFGQVQDGASLVAPAHENPKTTATVARAAPPSGKIDPCQDRCLKTMNQPLRRTRRAKMSAGVERFVQEPVGELVVLPPHMGVRDGTQLPREAAGVEEEIL